MSKTLQILIGAACLVVIFGGAWIGYSQYAAHAEAKRLEASISQMNYKRMVRECDELLRKPIELDLYTRDSCKWAKRMIAEAE